MGVTEFYPASVLLLTLQVLVISGLILTLFSLRHRFGLGLLYVFIGSNQYLQVVLSPTLFVPITSEIRVSFGSVVIFSSTLFAILLTYLQEDIPRTRSLIYGVVVSNLTLTGLAWLIDFQTEYLSGMAVAGVSTEILSVNPRAFLIGTAALILDAFMIVILYEVLLAKAKRVPLAFRLVTTLLLVLCFDALFFSIGAFFGTEHFGRILANQLVGKTLAGILYGLVLYVYIQWTQHDTPVVVRPKGGETGVFSILTYREKYQLVKEQLEHSEAANLAKNRFLAHMSHELRTPLNAVIGFTNVLRKNKRGQLSDKELLFLDRIFGNARHLLELINGILDLSKIESGKFDLFIESFQLNQLISETVEELRVQAVNRGLYLEVDLPSFDVGCETDRSALKQVLINLIGNGLKFTESGGVRVRLEADAQERLPIAIEVTDTGIGITPDLLEAIFEAFRQAESTTQRRYGGSGLGLAISRALCDQMDYQLEVESEVGKGSVFRVVMSSGL